MNALSPAASALPATLKKILAPSPRAKNSALGSEQTGSLTFAKSNTVGVDASVRFSDLGLSSATTKLTVGLTLAAGQKYSFSFFSERTVRR